MKDVIELAKQAGLCLANDEKPLIERFAALVGNAKLEEAAEVCFRNAALTPCPIDNARMLECGASIRNLKEPTP